MAKHYPTPQELFGVDETLCDDGAVYKFSCYEIHCGFLGPTNEKFQAVLTRRMRNAGIDEDELVRDTETSITVNIEAFAEGIMLKWFTVEFDENGVVSARNPVFPDKDGNPLPLSFENKVKVLRQYPIMRNKILDFCRDHRNFQKRELDKAAGK